LNNTPDSLTVKGNPSKISSIGGKTRVAETKVQRIIFPHRFPSQRKTSESIQFYIQLNRSNLSSSPHCHGKMPNPKFNPGPNPQS
jgi:hypothetical protein